MVTLEQRLDMLGQAVDRACKTIDELRAERRELLALLKEFIEMDIPCPFRGNDGRLKDFCEWYKKVQDKVR